MPSRRNYGQEKRAKEMARQKKREEKLKRRQKKPQTVQAPPAVETGAPDAFRAGED